MKSFEFWKMLFEIKLLIRDLNYFHVKDIYQNQYCPAEGKLENDTISNPTPHSSQPPPPAKELSRCFGRLLVQITSKDHWDSFHRLLRVEVLLISYQVS
jgi:hypothetical protein